MSTETHFVVNQAAMGVTYVVNLAAAKEKRLAVNCVKQCVFRTQSKKVALAYRLPV